MSTKPLFHKFRRLLPRRHVWLLRLRKDDVVVFRHPEVLDWGVAENLYQALSAVFPDNRVVILQDGGGELQIVRPGDA